MLSAACVIGPLPWKGLEEREAEEKEKGKKEKERERCMIKIFRGEGVLDGEGVAVNDA